MAKRKAKAKTKRKAKRKAIRKAALRAGRVSAEEEIMVGVRRAGFKTFRSYVASRSLLPLREMAVELGVPESTFLNHHAQWVRDNAPPPAVEV